MTRFVVSIFSVGLMVLCAGAACGQNYPNKPIRIVTSEPGGGADFTSRLIAQAISPFLGQPVIVENRGGSGIIAAEIVAKASPDGYTLMVIGSSLWLFPFLRDHVSYDPVKDYSPVTVATSPPNLIVVHPSVAAKSVKELIALARARPGELNYASGPAGSSNHLAAELFKSMAGVNIVRITYKGSAPALNDLLGGQVQLMFPNAAAVMSHVKSGRLRALAVTGAQPSALLPGLPTAAATGLPGYESATIQGVLAPARTPAAIVNRLNRDIVRGLNTADVKERFLNAGVETVGSSPQEFAASSLSDLGRTNS